MINIKRVTILVLFFVLITGCSNETISTDSTDSNILIIEKGEVKTYEDILTVEDIEEDIDGDEKKEHIKLSISPAPKPDPENEGQYLWDDSQVWQLVVEDEGDFYTLFDDHVQGLAELYIANEGQNQNAIIFQTKGTTLSLLQYKHNQDGYFEKKVVYNEGTILHRSTIK
ncbi:hypothetical protein [Chengkuizengella sediminis]|uniref:hypothetical protein n=1 Tax=Chengkuizengella sediminis TaxID=1885917 RepID=UPI001389EBEE|nr:hypothetical protein [Chengkuizengella sediminis]NDI35775.1 hypothetical protein [Chengkuizengella sediminis]